MSDRLLRDGQLGLADTNGIVTQIARALHAAHRLDVVHRDIKPENIFLLRTDDGMVVKVFDFGIAKSPELPPEWEQADTMIGTPQFFSPELFRGEPVDASADLWALAVTAYRCLTGRLPFEADTLALLSIKVMQGDYLRPSAARPVLPESVDAFFERAFARDRAARFGSAREMATALASLVPAHQRAADSEWGAGLGGDTLSPVTGGRRWTGPVGGVIAVLAVVAAAILWFRMNAEPSEPRNTAAPEPPPSVASEEPADSVEEPVPAPATASATTAASVAAPESTVIPWTPGMRPKPKSPSPVGEPPPPPRKPSKGGEDYGF